MRKEYDLIRELGRGNWIDEVAGEAVLWGYSTVDPELEARGAELSKMVKEIKFDNDQFYKVEAAAKELQRLVGKKQREESSIYIDRLRAIEGDKWPMSDWEYGLVYINPFYEVRILLPAFYSESELGEKQEMETAVMSCFEDPEFKSYKKEKSNGESIFTGQMVWKERYYNEKKD